MKILTTTALTLALISCGSDSDSSASSDGPGFRSDGVYTTNGTNVTGMGTCYTGASFRDQAKMRFGSFCVQEYNGAEDYDYAIAYDYKVVEYSLLENKTLQINSESDVSCLERPTEVGTKVTYDVGDSGNTLAVGQRSYTFKPDNDTSNEPKILRLGGCITEDAEGNVSFQHNPAWVPPAS